MAGMRKGKARRIKGYKAAFPRPLIATPRNSAVSLAFQARIPPIRAEAPTSKKDIPAIYVCRLLKLASVAARASRSGGVP
jgi:hypothetical protein